MTQQTILASRPAAMVLALTLVVGLSAPFVMLPQAQAQSAGGTASGSPMGTAELSPTPPQDTVAVPPNIVLMLDDSGSMKADYMPDFSYLNNNSKNEALINANNNGVYYDPAVTYAPPPKANSTSAAPNFYPSQTDMSNVPVDGFGVRTTQSKSLFTYDGSYECDHSDNCGNGSPGTGKGRISFNVTVAGTPPKYYFQYSTGAAAGPSYTVYYVAPASQSCGTQPRCVIDTDTSGAAAPKGIPAGQNIANWFAYYHTRILMAKSGLMTAFSTLDPKYRFGFGSINGKNNGALPTPNATFGSNKIAQAQPFGDGSTGTRKDAFWKWISTINPGSSTPLRVSLDAVGQYYQSSQPWQSQPGDPGYSSGGTNSPLACRASYTILTTDGFWNESTAPTVGNASGTPGTVYTDTNGKQYGYTPVAPFSGGGVSGSVSLADVANYYWKTDLQPSITNQVPTSDKDPAFWQHMTTFTMGLGFMPTGISPSGTTIQQIFAWAQGGAAISGFSWPTPGSNNINNIADLAHAAVNGHGDFFSATSPQKLAEGFASAISQINARNVPPTPSTVNASVVTTGALSFSTGYNTGDWTGALRAVTLNADGTVDAANPVWDAGKLLDTAYHSTTGYKTRTVYTSAYASGGTFSGGVQFGTAYAGSLDAVEKAGLQSPVLAGGNDTLANRMNYLLGDSTYEGSLYRIRNRLLGAIIRSQPQYVSYPTGNYYNRWPNQADGTAAPEVATGAQAYDAFVSANNNRPGTLYVGANDGMLHAFNAALKCSKTDPVTGKCISYGPDQEANAGKERWAFIPRAVYANLGNLTNNSNFYYRPTVDETPVTRDVFFSSDKKWHTLLAGGVGLGGRGVYALDITDPTTFSASNVLWEFNADMTIGTGCVASYGTCKASDLGYTVSKPSIGRLANGKWVVLVANGYFPDCAKPDTPTNDVTNCQAIQNQAPTNYSALFVLDAQTGKVIAELKTPTGISGVTSFGLATPVLGDYDNDQIDDVAFAGDLQGNLWRFDLSDPSPSNWKVALTYKGTTDASGNQGVQPITTMPRLFPDPATNRFMVVFGTGKFLGVGDNVVNKDAGGNNLLQSIYGVRDAVDSSSKPVTFVKANLVQQALGETNVTSPNSFQGATARTLTSNPVPASKGGWYIDLKTTASDGTQNNAGERVVVHPGAIFASNTVAFQTLITGAALSDPCNPSTLGALMFISALDGSPGTGVSSLGGKPVVGGRINNARTSGSLPIVSAMGGGQAYIPGVTLTGTSNNNPFTTDFPVWRRRSWLELHEDQ